MYVCVLWQIRRFFLFVYICFIETDHFFSVPPFVKSENQEIDESNKGHQMLRKMGWGGSGLGANEQGIDTPISGGDIRDRQDQFKGVGMNLNDPYENFRKNKGAAFITRMKARAEERALEGKLLFCISFGFRIFVM